MVVQSLKTKVERHCFPGTYICSNQIHLMFSGFSNVVTVFVLDVNNSDIPH